MTDRQKSSGGSGPSGAADAPDAEEWLDSHGDALYRFARARVGSREAAEDLVQETLLAALAARGGFRGEAAVRTWLLGILRKKIADHFRRMGSSVAPDGDSASDTAARGPAFERVVFTDDGLFRHTPSPWKTPSDTLEEGEFWDVLDGCLDRLPAPFAVAFTLRELDEVPTEEVRKQLGVSAGNLRVRLYRARLMLRECLERNWFTTTM